jgi:hypothetical protein
MTYRPKLGCISRFAHSRTENLGQGERSLCEFSGITLAAAS